LDVGLTTPPWKRLVTKSEEAIAGYFSWQKLLRKARVHAGCQANNDDDDYDDDEAVMTDVIET
jgi:hypothetical protein